MKLTIIADDSTVYKDRVAFFPVDISAVPAHVHALQFDTTTNTGHIELKDGSNEAITTLPDWAVTASTNYDTAVAAHNAAEAAKAAALLATGS